MILNAPLYNGIKKLAETNSYPMCMPGHKRNKAFVEESLLDFDFTEVDGADNMHLPEGIILEAEKKMAEHNKCDESLFLVNGGSSGLLTAICGTLCEGDKIAVCRNAHKSVHNGLVLSGALPVYIPPEILPCNIAAGITTESLEKAFENHPDIKAVLVTSPTYEGFVSDINSLAECAHKHNAILIVDETHGAHFAFSDNFPKTAMELGADISIQSWHKTLPCPNQSAVINFNHERLDVSRLKEAYSMVQTTSPSYIMMCLMDKARALLSENPSYFAEYSENLNKIRKRLKELCNLRLSGDEYIGKYGVSDYDISKIVILTGENLSGSGLAQILLKEYNIQIELCALNHIIAMTSVADRSQGLDLLADALLGIDKTLKPYKAAVCKISPNEISAPLISPRAAFYSKFKKTELSRSQGLICGEAVTVYPPDIPLILPGEIIKSQHISLINEYRQNGISIIGADDGKIKTTEVNTYEL